MLEHHAYLVQGSREAGEAFVREQLKAGGFALENNPDLHFFREPTLNIEDARSLRSRAERKAFGARSVFIVLSERIGREAQNALLKTLEEPPSGATFFIVSAHEELLLPTLRSRVQKIILDERSVAASSKDKLSPESFLALAPAKRVAFAKKFVDAEKPLGPFLDALLVHLKSSTPSDTLKKIFTLRRYADDQSASARMIIEHLAFVVK